MKLFKHAKSLLVAAFALALVCVAFAFTTKVSAADIATGVKAEYDPISDTIEFTAETDQTLTIYVLKDATTAMTGKEKSKASVVVSGGAATLVLNDSKKGLKAAENKPLYLYVAVSGAAITADAGLKANFKLAATDVKKVDSVTLNYGKAVAENEDTVLVVKATSTAEGATSALVTDLSTVAVTDIKVDQNKKKIVFYEAVGTEYLGNSLYDAITDFYSTAKGEKYYKHTLNVKILGTDKQVTVDGVAYDGRRSSKAKSVSLKNPAKAAKVKVDYLKGTIALKSGLDFVVLTEATTPSAIEAELWQTILPASDKGSTTSLYVQSINYTYVKKLTDESTVAEKASFYKGDKIKSLTLESICEAIWPNAVSNTAIIYVRKTATDKAPASKTNETEIKVTKPLAAPVIATTGGAITATYDAKKKAFTLGKGNISGANTNGGYEYLVVTKAQYDSNNIDFGSSKWSKFVPDKALKTALSSTVVYKTGTTTKEKISTVNSNKELVENIYILIRGAGVKENAKSKIAGALPTEYAVTKFHVEGTGETAKVQWLIVDP